MPTRSPLAPKGLAALPPIEGVRLNTAASGLRYQGRDDLLVVELAKGTTVAGVLTRSLASSAPVDWCRKALKGGKAGAIVVNSGNANAFTGKDGDMAVKRTVDAVRAQLGCPRSQVFVASTGVIGEPLPVTKIESALPALCRGLAADRWREAAAAIMTTDTFPKAATQTAIIDGTTVVINGFAKGSGMIAPDMATMLGFVFTDARLPAPVLQKLLSAANEKSFNAITVDGDTSTSDTVLLCATGKARHERIESPGDPALRDFRFKLDELMTELAHLIVRDGEGASKFVSITVTGAASNRAARKIAFSIANSPLVKTAIAGEDANWGRIVMAIGKAGQRADRDRIVIRIGGVTITRDGQPVAGYDEAPVAAHMKGQEIEIEADVGVGRGQATVWTCDLTHGYIDINGSYRS